MNVSTDAEMHPPYHSELRLPWQIERESAKKKSVFINYFPSFDAHLRRPHLSCGVELIVRPNRSVDRIALSTMRFMSKIKKFFLVKPIKSGKGGKADNADDAGDGNRNLSNSFVEHHQSIQELKNAHPQSHINVDEPRRSAGLSSSTAAQLLLVNIVPYGHAWCLTL